MDKNVRKLKIVPFFSWLIFTIFSDHLMLDPVVGVLLLILKAKYEAGHLILFVLVDCIFPSVLCFIFYDLDPEQV